MTRDDDAATGLDGPRFYDDDQVFATYMRHRARAGGESPND